MESRRRGEDGLRFFRYGLAHHYIFGEHKPGRTDIWANFEKARHALPAAGADHGIGTPDQLRTHLRHFEESGRRPDRLHPARRSATSTGISAKRSNCSPRM